MSKTKKAWHKGMQHPKEITEMRSQIHDFITVYSELRMTQPGWYGPNQAPSVMKPPQSSEWIKGK